MVPSMRGLCSLSRTRHRRGHPNEFWPVGQWPRVARHVGLLACMPVAEASSSRCLFSGSAARPLHASRTVAAERVAFYLTTVISLAIVRVMVMLRSPSRSRTHELEWVSRYCSWVLYPEFFLVDDRWFQGGVPPVVFFALVTIGCLVWAVPLVMLYRLRARRAGWGRPDGRRDGHLLPSGGVIPEGEPRLEYRRAVDASLTRDHDFGAHRVSDGPPSPKCLHSRDCGSPDRRWLPDRRFRARRLKQDSRPDRYRLQESGGGCGAVAPRGLCRIHGSPGTSRSRQR